ncbi:MAG TPA: glucose 1-dehydrogenase, partial [Gemmatimonadaceae bacterium]|nr:glucose 1-dehydrogenase [Gemmatimonadaceae bacterium]
AGPPAAAARARNLPCLGTLNHTARGSDHMPFRGLRGRKVLVTGGSSGIGQAIAVRFAEEGADVAINYRSGEREARETEELIERAMERCLAALGDCGVRTARIRADVSKADDVAAMVGTTIDELGGLDILINNAGIQVAGESHEVAVADFDRVIAVNLRGAFLCAREVLRHWIESARPGIILNVSSVHEVIPKPRFAGYAASKGGMRALTQTLALEYADRRIRVNAIGPGATETPINRAWVDDPAKREEVEHNIPLGRAGKPEEMAAAAAFLCSDEAAYITGQTLFVDGGLTLYPAFRESWSSE